MRRHEYTHAFVVTTVSALKINSLQVNLSYFIQILGPGWCKRSSCYTMRCKTWWFCWWWVSGPCCEEWVLILIDESQYLLTWIWAKLHTHRRCSSKHILNQGEHYYCREGDLSRSLHACVGQKIRERWANTNNADPAAAASFISSKNSPPPTEQ